MIKHRRLEIKTGKKTGNKTEDLSADEKEWYDWLHADCPDTKTDVVPLSSGVDTAEDEEVREALSQDVDLSIQRSIAGTPSPSGLMDLLALKTPVKREGQGESSRAGSTSGTKRPPPPPLRTPTKKQRGEDLMAELVAEQLKYYKRKNELLDNEIERRKRANSEDVEERLCSLERAMGWKDPE